MFDQTSPGPIGCIGLSVPGILADGTKLVDASEKRWRDSEEEAWQRLGVPPRTEPAAPQIYIEGAFPVVGPWSGKQLMVILPLGLNAFAVDEEDANAGA